MRGLDKRVYTITPFSLNIYGSKSPPLKCWDQWETDFWVFKCLGALKTIDTLDLSIQIQNSFFNCKTLFRTFFGMTFVPMLRQMCLERERGEKGGKIQNSTIPIIYA